MSKATKSENQQLTIIQQKGITNLGTLSGLSCSGKVLFTSLIQSNSPTTGSVAIMGGVGIQGTTNLGKDLHVNGFITCSNPKDPNHVATKSYIDSQKLQFGKGFKNINGIVNIHASQTEITELGVLKNLNCQGPVVIGCNSNANDIHSGALNVKGGAGINRNLHIGGDLYVNGHLNFGKCVIKDPEIDTDIVNKRYLDRCLDTRYDSKTLYTKNGTLYVSEHQSQITSVGTLKSLTVDGQCNFNSTVLVNTPTKSNHVTNKSYVDAALPTFDAGLSKINNKVSINKELTHVTKVGVLSNLTVSGKSNLDSAVVTGDLKIGNKLETFNFHSQEARIDQAEIDQLTCKRLLLDKKLKIGQDSVLDNVKCNNLGVNKISSLVLETDNLHSQDAKFHNLKSQKTSVENLDVSNAKIDHIDICAGNITSISGNNCSFKYGDIDNLLVKNLESGSVSFSSSYSINTKLILDNYTLAPSDHCIIVQNTTKNVSITLIDNKQSGGAVFNQGQVVYILNLGNHSVAIGSFGSLDFKGGYLELIYINEKWNTKSTNVSKLEIKKHVPIAYGGVYGDGCMGDFIVTSNTTLTQDVYYDNLTINQDVQLKTNGWRIFVKNVLMFHKNAVIHNNGHDPQSTFPASQSDISYLGRGINGMNASKIHGYQQIRQQESKMCHEKDKYFLIPSGGYGGVNLDHYPKQKLPKFDSHLLPNAFGGVHAIKTFPACITARIDGKKVHTALGGGCGYGEFLRDNPKQTDYIKPGSGGGSGGFVVVCARLICGTGSIQSNGANGSDAATNVNVKLVRVGGGGGGSGGVVSIVSSSGVPDTISLQATAGHGGESIYCEDAHAGTDGIIIQNLI